ELEAVNKVASWYTNALGDAVKTPVVPEGCYSSWAQYTIQLGDENQRTEIQGKLKEQGIPTMVYYPKPMHEQTAFDGLKQYVQCPVTERLCKTVVSLPLDGYKTYESCVTVSTVIKSFALMV
ncbi:MAG: DegT/DnrJ/EryC1/StrS family aminotransferase, partial [Clostridia bacterium]|nr:DegT/DnrJ/EryC1/StrS family aminotransferase [Clostridia bacterium]